MSRSVLTYTPWAGFEDLGALAGKLANPVKHHQSQLQQEEEIVRSAAEKYHINPSILWGVYGKETSHGTDVKPSSTGAEGPFQFEPETAKAYGYPLNANTNGVTSMSAFAKQADAAANYISHLLPGGRGEANLRSAGKGKEPMIGGITWSAAYEKALRAYSGGGYGLSEVRQAGHSFGSGIATEQANKAETETVEHPGAQSGGIFGELLDFIKENAIKGTLDLVLLLVGAALVVYGIMVAVRPPERAFSVPTPRLI